MWRVNNLQAKAEILSSSKTNSSKQTYKKHKPFCPYLNSTSNLSRSYKLCSFYYYYYYCNTNQRFYPSIFCTFMFVLRSLWRKQILAFEFSTHQIQLEIKHFKQFAKCHTCSHLVPLFSSIMPTRISYFLSFLLSVWANYNFLLSYLSEWNKRV